MRCAGVGVVDDVFGTAQVFGDQFALRQHQRFDQVGGEEAILRADAGRQRQFGNLVRNDIEVADFLRALAEKLEEAGVVDAVIIVVAAMHIEGSLGHGAAAHVQHVGQAFADRGVQRFVHVRDALSGGEIGRAQSSHGKAGGYGSSRMFAFGLDENQRTAGDIDMSVGRFFRPVFAHLSGGRDGICAGRVGRLTFTHNDGGVAVHSFSDTGISKCTFFAHRFLSNLN